MVAAQTRSASVRRCAAAALVVWTGRSTVAAGSIAAEFGFNNHSASTCFLHGYPRVQMFTAVLSPRAPAVLSPRAPGPSYWLLTAPAGAVQPGGLGAQKSPVERS
jgi:hypothetical protein